MPESRNDAKWTRRGKAALEIGTSFSIIGLCGVVAWVEVTGRTTGVPPKRDLPGIEGASAPSPPARTPRILLPKVPLSLKDVPTKGKPGAKIALIEFSDFQCPFCGRFARETLPTLMKEYVDEGKLLMAFKHLPLKIHEHAEVAAQAGECARRQGRFWEMHDGLFADQTHLDTVSLVGQAKKIGLEAGACSACLAGDSQRRVQEDAAEAQALNIASTPIFLAGIVQADGTVRITGSVQGAKGKEDFRKYLDQMLTNVNRGEVVSAQKTTADESRSLMRR